MLSATESSTNLCPEQLLPHAAASPPRFAGLLRWWPEAAVLVLWAVVVAVGVVHHEPWADEAQAWQMARTLPLRTLLFHALRYEGSPGLWHVLLYWLVHLHCSYTGMRWVAAGFALAGTILLLFRCPLPRALRLVLPFTFFLGYQYAIVARPYVLAPLLLYLVADNWNKRRPLTVALLLGLGFNLASYVSILCVGFAAAYVVDRGMLDWRRTRARSVFALLLFAGLALFGIACVYPAPPDLVFPHDSLATLGWRALYVLPGMGVIKTSFALDPIIVAGAVALIWMSVLLWEARMFAFLLTLWAMIVFDGFYGYPWHAGLLVPMTIAIVWILHGRGTCIPRGAVRLVWILVGLQIATGCAVYAIDYRKPYSGSLAAAEWLRPFVERGAPMASTFAAGFKPTEFFVTGLRPYFNRMNILNQKEPYWKFSSTEHTDSDFVKALEQHPRIVIMEAPGTRQLQVSPKALKAAQHGTLERFGYEPTRAFCGVHPFGIFLHMYGCHLIFEPSDAVGNGPGPIRTGDGQTKNATR